VPGAPAPAAASAVEDAFAEDGGAAVPENHHDFHG